MKAVARKLVWRDIVPHVSRGRGFGQQLSDHVPEFLLRSGDLFVSMQERRETRDLQRAFRVIESLQTGMVGLNQGVVSNPAAPFGGVKQSGFGREGGREGIEEYLDVKYVAMNL